MSAARSLCAVVVALVAAVLLGGCEAAVLSEVSVQDARTATTRVSLRLTGEAAEALGPAESDSLEALIAQRVGVRPVRTQEGDGVVYSAEVPYDALVANADVFGIGSATVQPPASDEGVAVSLELVEPEALAAAFAEGVKDQSDAEALVAAFLGGTSVGVRVSFPGPAGEVRFVDQDGRAWPVEVVRGERDVLVSQPLSEYRGGVLVVEGSLDGPGGRPWVAVGATAAAMAIAAVVVTRLSRAQRPSRRPTRPQGQERGGRR